MSPTDNQQQTNRDNPSPPDRRSRHALLATIATSLAVIGLAVEAPAAGAATTFTPATPNLGIIPFPGDEFQASANGTLIPVDPLHSRLGADLQPDGERAQRDLGPVLLSDGEVLPPSPTTEPPTPSSCRAERPGPEGRLLAVLPHLPARLQQRALPERRAERRAAFPGLQKPDPDSFTASNSGKGLFFASVPQNLLAAAQLQVSVIYNFDGNTF